MKSNLQGPAGGTNKAAQSGTSGAQLKLADLVYIFFRHRWKILVPSVFGILAAIAVWSTSKPLYGSSAKILIRYVLESRSGTLEGTDQIRTPDSRGDNIITSELELLSSLDLAEEVATSLGATNVMRGVDDSATVSAAAAYIKQATEVKVLPKSSVIALLVKHPDPGTARNLAAALTAKYIRLHARVHRNIDAIDELTRQADLKKTVVETAEAELRRIKGELEITTVAQAQKDLSDLLGKLSGELSAAAVQLETSQAALAPLTNRIASSANSPSPETNVATPPRVVIPVPSEPIREQYESLKARLRALRRQESEVLLTYTAASPTVRRISDQISQVDGTISSLVAQHPGLTNNAVSSELPVESGSPARGLSPVQTTMDPSEAISKVLSAQARVRALSNQLGEVKAKLRRISEKESEITQLERRLLIGEKQYEAVSASLEQARIEDTLSTRQLANLSVIQAATPGFPVTTKRAKVAAGLGVGGIVLGVGLALLMEFFVDTSIRRPGQLVGKLRLPLFLSLPRLSGLEKAGASNAIAERDGGLEGHPELASYSEALRDRLIMHFRANDVVHNPKLIGVSSFNAGAGVTTVATSLAASLSETGEGRVLYVDVNMNSGASAHPFHKGRPVTPIADLLGQQDRSGAQVGENLYAVSLLDPNNTKIGVLPKTLANLLPRIRASDYDYIIFDLPPVTQTSATARVAGLMDINLMVVESEKTHEGIAQQATSLLGESHTKMVAVLNKHRRHLPRSIDGDL